MSLTIFFRSWNATFLLLIQEKEGLKALRIFGLKSLVWGREGDCVSGWQICDQQHSLSRDLGTIG